MGNIVVKPDSHKEGDKWIPDGMIQFYDGPTLKEHRETYYEIKLDNKESADRYFIEASKKKYKIAE